MQPTGQHIMRGTSVNACTVSWRGCMCGWGSTAPTWTDWRGTSTSRATKTGTSQRCQLSVYPYQSDVNNRHTHTDTHTTHNAPSTTLRYLDIATLQMSQACNRSSDTRTAPFDAVNNFANINLWRISWSRAGCLAPMP